jgi:hypothetical protein
MLPRSLPGSRRRPQHHRSATSGHPGNLAIMKSTPSQPHSHHDRLSDTGPAVEDHGRVMTTSRQAAGFYRQAQRAVDAPRATAALRLAVDADPAFGLAIADLDAITGTVSDAPNRGQISWERHHIEVIRTAAIGNTQRAAGLLREHLASVGCDPLALRITAQLGHPGRHDDDFEHLVGQLPGCHATPWPPSP